MARLIEKSHTISAKSGIAVIISLLITGYLMHDVHAEPNTSGDGNFTDDSRRTPNAPKEGFAYGAGYFFEFSDNIQRTPTFQQNEWINSVIAAASYQDAGPVLFANLLAQVEYRDYRLNTFEDGPHYFVDSSLLWRIAPQKFHWMFADRYSQITRDAALPDTPDNRVYANILNTGPDAYIRLNQVNTLLLGLRFGNASYSEGEFDSQRYSAFARWLYATSSITTYSLNYETAKVRYVDLTENEDFLRQDAFFRFDRHQGFNSILVDLGATQIDQESTGITTGYLGRFSMNQRVTSFSSVGLLVASEYLDGGTVLLASTTDPVTTPGVPDLGYLPGGITTDFFYTKRILGYYNRNDNINILNVSAYYLDIDYEFTLQDRSELGGRLEVTHNLSDIFAASAYGSRVVMHYLDNPRDDDENEIGFRLLFRINRNFNSTLDLRRTWRNSTDAAFEFTDNRILLSLSYSSGPLFEPRTGVSGGHVEPSFNPQ